MASAEESYYDAKARQALILGIDTLANVAKATLGPRAATSFWRRDGARPR